ncbi:MAG TPA: MarR family winged helix-turn-helix transcriptional regulator [Lacunisphaera sp.]|nr:MarR family winged helix-turn-helix transcriptional regulator [Lacunisphaera sp.]
MIRPDTLVFRTLAAMSRQRRDMPGTRCDAVAELLHTGSLVHLALRRQLEEAGLTDLKFAVLVALYALEPHRATTNDLAFYTGYTRPAVAEAITELSARRLVASERDTTERRVLYLRLTPAGRQLGERTALDYLRAIARMTRDLKPPALAALQRACVHLAQGALRLSSPPQPSSA